MRSKQVICNLWTPAPLCISLFLIMFILPTGPLYAERVFFAGYNGGFYIKSEENGGMELKLGGAFQSDYRYYNESQRADNRFDIRRSRLKFSGRLTQWARFGMEFEFQGSETDTLITAWMEGIRSPHFLRFGQYKQPFSFEWQTRDKALHFAERSIMQSLCPNRDIGLMLHGSFLRKSIHYAAGIFNGDGADGSVSGNQEDSPEFAMRFILAPFSTISSGWFSSFHVGGSVTWAEIDTANINLRVKTTGMAGSSRYIYELSHNTKFGVLQSVDERLRTGFEASWAYGPVGLSGEYLRFEYTELQPAGKTPSNAEFNAWYASIFCNITGEPVIISNGVLKPVYPHRFFNPDEGTWGAFCLAFRAEHFSGDSDWINPALNVSVEEADAYSIALNWVMFPMSKIILDYTRTQLSAPVRARVLPDGSVDYIEKENVVTVRLSIDF